jgi:hypothetical protein
MNLAELESLAPGDLEELPDSYQAAPLDLLSFKLSLWELQRPAVAARVQRTGVGLSVTDITASQWWVAFALLTQRPCSGDLVDACKPRTKQTAAWTWSAQLFISKRVALGTLLALCVGSKAYAHAFHMHCRCGLQNAFQVATGQRKKRTIEMAAGSGVSDPLVQDVMAAVDGAEQGQMTTFTRAALRPADHLLVL